MLTCACKTAWVRGPPSIRCTSSSLPCSWNKTWVTTEDYLSSLSCVLIWFNEAICRRSGITTVDWREKEALDTSR